MKLPIGTLTSFLSVKLMTMLLGLFSSVRDIVSAEATADEDKTNVAINDNTVAIFLYSFKTFPYFLSHKTYFL